MNIGDRVKLSGTTIGGRRVFGRVAEVWPGGTVVVDLEDGATLWGRSRLPLHPSRLEAAPLSLHERTRRANATARGEKTPGTEGANER